MGWELVASHVILPGSVAAVAAAGAWRAVRLLRYGRDARLVRLAWFYALFSASLVCIAIWTGRLAYDIGEAFDALHGGAPGATMRSAHEAFAAAHAVDGLVLAHHALMLASLAVAVRAFTQKRAEGAIAGALGFAALAAFVPVALALEAALTLYLAVQAILNHMERRTPGALQVAGGFLLFFLGHLSYFLFHHPGAARTPLGDVLSLVGLALLVQLLPRPTA